MPGGMQLKAEVLSTSACALCGACLDWCPYLKNIEDHLVLRFDCPVEHGRCYSVCPRTLTDWQAINERYLADVPYDSDIGAYQTVFRVRRLQPIQDQQDGGTVSTLLQTALDNNMVEGVLITGSGDPLTPQPYLADQEEDIRKAAGSRFLASPSLRKIMEAREKGMEKLAVVGRPCQVQALRKMDYNKPADSPPLDVLSIGLFCMWSLSWSFKDYLASTYPDLTFLRMAIPQHAVELYTNEGIKQIPVETVQSYIRPGCRYCLDMTSELADISVGAFEPEAGWNTVIVRTERGRELLDKAREANLLQIEEYPSEELERLRGASHNKKVRGLRNIKQAVDEQKLTPFIDLSSSPYREIIAESSAKEGF
ncbi:MAG TPA: Coenzyme F420 hydrogenase/dehydrogenase, beta subunit C-terminal domain [Syntrophomonadaceae bacterium]|nr:Coenzyme F420 hydrogenase/dehydrogenase, beta subunit C-terminal domain [Syntrophomonadaceae bacterium]HPU48484.1 Coenzyme F420 hydrogenase/dehydrogenase, beta subunit C-terminal domain [Syntrophomonadaceae bacterium]